MISEEAWSFYRTSSGVRLCWELEKPKGPEGTGQRLYRGTLRAHVATLKVAQGQISPGGRPGANLGRDRVTGDFGPHRDGPILRIRARPMPESGQGPRGGVRLFHQQSTRITQLPLEPHVVQIWSSNSRNFEATRAAYSTVWYRGTSLIRNIPPVGPYRRTMTRIPCRPWLGGWAVSYERGTPAMPIGGRTRQLHPSAACPCAACRSKRSPRFSFGWIEPEKARVLNLHK